LALEQSKHTLSPNLKTTMVFL